MYGMECNGSMDFNDPKEFDDILVSPDQKGISIGSMDFDNPKVYGDTFIFDGLVVHGVFMNDLQSHSVLTCSPLK